MQKLFISFSKAVANTEVINANNATSGVQKMAILIEEEQRILRNTSVSILTKELKKEIIQNLNLKMKEVGHSEVSRSKVTVNMKKKKEILLLNNSQIL